MFPFGATHGKPCHMSDNLKDPVVLAQALMRHNTVTPCDDTSQDDLAKALESLGFRTKRYPIEITDNLYARLGTEGPNLCFSGHTDVVPIGDEAGWTHDPFTSDIENGILYGRGASDMKAAIAAFVSATARYLDDHGLPKGSISFLISGDEEGPGTYGMRRFLPEVVADGEKIDHCIVGEPTSEEAVADIIKNGRRGSINGVITATGKQGHVAYPHKAANPVPHLLDALQKLRDMELDDGSPGFQPSILTVTSVDVGNTAHNVLPASATAMFNIRFNPKHTGAGLSERILELIDGTTDGVTVTTKLAISGEAFYTEPGKLTDILVNAVKAETGRTPELTTGGGTSDARWIKDVCPVAELGLSNETAHKVDEHVAIDDIETLCRVYYRVIAQYFESTSEA